MWVGNVGGVDVWVEKTGVGCERREEVGLLEGIVLV